MVKKAREGIMEFLLANHPLDCPICDQGGECDLQDQAMMFGNDRGRFYELKRAVQDKDCGPLVKTIMTRCIHCTRCVRFSSEVAGVGDMGVTGRGNSMEVGTYVEKTLISEISGNLIDICPVGALTSKPYAFNARPWELRKIESVDVSDSMGANINVALRGKELLRITPVVNDAVNEEWLTDRGRFNYDGLYRQRLVKPLVRKEGKLVEVSWSEALDEVVKILQRPGVFLEGIVGNMVEVESIVVLKDLIGRHGFGRLVHQTGSGPGVDVREDYLCNSGLERVEEADVCLLVGVNVRLEMPLLGVRLRKGVRGGSLVVGSCGVTTEQYFKVLKLGSDVSVLVSIFEGRNLFSATLRRAEKPVVIVGVDGMPEELRGVLRSGLRILEKYTKLVGKDWNGKNYLSLGASSAGVSDLGGGSNQDESVDGGERVAYLLDSDEIELKSGKYSKVIYQGHHGDRMVEEADIVLPGVTYVEKEGLYTNLEGRVQLGRFVSFPPGECRSDWRILRAIVEKSFEGGEKYAENIEGVRNRLMELVPYYLNKGIRKGSVVRGSGVVSGCRNIMLNGYLRSMYSSDSISRASKVMGECMVKVKKYVSNYRWK